jgi:hypothetical protein
MNILLITSYTVDSVTRVGRTPPISPFASRRFCVKPGMHL